MRLRMPPIRSRSLGSASHNRATEPGKLEVTIWCWSARWHREVTITLDEESAERLAANLSRFGIGIKG